MNYRTADRLASVIVAQVRQAVKGDVNWTHAIVTLSEKDRGLLDTNPSAVTGRLPMGWRLSGLLGSPTVTILRNQ
jgi:hypothetical protein